MTTEAPPVANVAAATSYLDSVFGPADAPPPETPAPAPPPPADPGGIATSPSETPVPEKEPSLAAIIRDQRQQREARALREREAGDLRTQLQTAQDQLARLSKTDLLGDPIGFALAHGLTEAEMALVGQAYLYHLVPDKAPPDLRYKMLEAKTTRERKVDDQRRQDQERAQQAQAAGNQIQQYTAVLGVAVQTWDGQGDKHPFPESRAWFGGSHEEYAESLVHTARNMADTAQARGERADLTPKAVAETLERDLAVRAQRLRTKGGSAPQQSATAAQGPGGKQPAVLSTRGQGASPAPPAMSERERIQRAAAVVFGPHDAQR